MYLLSCLSETFEICPWDSTNIEILTKKNWCHLAKNLVFRRQNDPLTPASEVLCSRVSRLLRIPILKITSGNQHLFCGKYLDMSISNEYQNIFTLIYFVMWVPMLKNHISGYPPFSLRKYLDMSISSKYLNIFTLIHFVMWVPTLHISGYPPFSYGNI